MTVLAPSPAPPTRRAGSIALIVAGVLAAALTSTALIVQALVANQVDLAVFQDAGAAYLTGYPLYSEDFPTRSGLRFIYAPIAAVMFAPLVFVDTVGLQVLWTVLNIALLWWVLAAVLRRLDFSRPFLLAVPALGAALLLEPVRSNFGFGQINIVLMALVIADCTGSIPRRFRGIAMATAASIKITPAAFGLFFLVRKDFATILRALGTVAALAAVGFWLLPGASVYFWLTEFFATERAGGHAYVRNQALTGVLTRSGVDDLVIDALWVVFAVTVVCAAAWSARRFTLSGEPMVALGIVALASLLAAPFAVSHHWVYSVLLVPLAIAPRYRNARPILVPAYAVFVMGPYFVLENMPATMNTAEVVSRHLIGNAQFFAAVVLLVTAVVAAASRRPEKPFTPEPSEPDRSDVLTTRT